MVKASVSSKSVWGRKAFRRSGTADRDLGDALGHLVADVLEGAPLLPVRGRERTKIVEGIMGTASDHGLHGALRYWPVPELVALDLPGGMGFVDALRAIWDTGDAAAPLDSRLPRGARTAMLDALRPTRIVGSDGEQHALRDGIPVEDGDALVVATSGTSGQPQGGRADARGRRRLGRGDHRSPRHRPRRATPGSPACPWPTSGGSPSSPAPSSPAPHSIVMPGFDADVVEEAGRSGRSPTSPWSRRRCGGSIPPSSTASSSGAARRPTTCHPTSSPRTA